MNGILVIDKPQDFTSFDVVAKLRGILHERRIGHGGTLDPMATGVLPVFVGEATKLADRDPAATKTYAASVRVGMRTDTGDVTGAVLEQSDARASRAALEQALQTLVGEGEQLPPMYSAVKINGKKLYEYARAGREVERKPRAITIFEASLTAYAPDAFSFTVRCTKGTYVRTLAETLCERAGTVGTLAALRRTQSGSFTEANAVSLSAVQDAANAGTLGALLTPPQTLFATLRSVELREDTRRLFDNGVRFTTARVCADAAQNEELVVRFGGRFLGLAKNEDGVFVKTLHYNNGND